MAETGLVLKKTQTKTRYQNQKLKILMVEDEKYIVYLYGKYFEKYGYDFYSAQNIEEAFNLAITHHPDVIFLDIIIPKNTEKSAVDFIAEQGYDFLQKIKKTEETKDILVFMFSNLDTDKDKKKALELGASGYIVKNKTEPKDLIETAHRVLKETFSFTN